MKSKLVFAILVVSVTLGVMIYFAVGSTAKLVVTVDELLKDGSARESIRLGARVTSEEIEYRSSPTRRVLFKVRDIAGPESRIVPVVYEGNMPDTLKTGRDVILEGDYDGSRFVASSLMTQCPSKYEPPVPGGSKSGAGKAAAGEYGAQGAAS